MKFGTVSHNGELALVANIDVKIDGLGRLSNPAVHNWQE